MRDSYIPLPWERSLPLSPQFYPPVQKPASMTFYSVGEVLRYLKGHRDAN